jgi:hypothetical protein
MDRRLVNNVCFSGLAFSELRRNFIADWLGATITDSWMAVICLYLSFLAFFSGVTHHALREIRAELNFSRYTVWLGPYNRSNCSLGTWKHVCVHPLWETWTKIFLAVLLPEMNISFFDGL